MVFRNLTLQRTLYLKSSVNFNVKLDTFFSIVVIPIFFLLLTWFTLMAILWEGSHTLPYYGFKLSKGRLEHIPQISLIEKNHYFCHRSDSLVVVSLWQKLIQDIEWNGIAQLSYFFDKLTYPPFKMSKSKFIFFSPQTFLKVKVSCNKQLVKNYVTSKIKGFFPFSRQ